MIENTVIKVQYQQIYRQKMSDHLEKHILKYYEPVKKIGSGAYGIVWKVIDRQDKSIHALKKNFDAFQNSTDAQRTYREIQFLKQISHPNIVHLQKVLKSENQKDIYLVFDFMDIDLYTLIRENLLGEKHKRYISYQVAKALFYLHSADLVHRDIKPSNVLVNQSCQAKVCDFGLVRSVGDESQVNPILTEYIATRWYRAPQILLGSKKYTKAIDVWSYGCMLAEMIKGKPFFPGNSTLNQIQRLLMWTGPPSLSDIKALRTDFGKQMLDLLSKIKPVSKKQWLPSCPQDALDLLNKALQFNPEKRYTMLDILKHPYFQEFYEPGDLVSSKHKIKIEINDETKLSLKQYRELLYNEIDEEEALRLSSPIKIIQKEPEESQTQKREGSAGKCQSSTGKNVFRNRAYKQVRSASKQRQDPAQKIINNYHNSIGMTNISANTRLAFQVYSRKNSLTVGNSMNLKKKYQSLAGKKKSEVSQGNTHKKHLKTENDNVPTQSNVVQRKKTIFNGIVQAEDNQFREQVYKRKKSTSEYERKRKSDVIGRYMYKNKKL